MFFFVFFFDGYFVNQSWWNWPLVTFFKLRNSLAATIYPQGRQVRWIYFYQTRVPNSVGLHGMISRDVMKLLEMNTCKEKASVTIGRNGCFVYY